MLGFYIFAAVLGGGLLLLSQLAGDHDANGGAGAGDHGHGPDVGVHGPAELLLGFFRPRNLIFFLAAFGISGTLLPLTGSVAPLALGLSVIMGLAAMALTHGVFTWLRRSDTAADTVADADLEGSVGRVVLPIRPGERGRNQVNTPWVNAIAARPMITLSPKANGATLPVSVSRVPLIPNAAKKKMRLRGRKNPSSSSAGPCTPTSGPCP